MNRDSEIFLSEYNPQDCIKLFDDTDRESLVVQTEFCFVLAAHAEQGYKTLFFLVIL